MASLVEIKGNYYLQFYDSNKQPNRKKVALGTKRKRVAKKLQRRYEDAYALGEYDPWTGKKLDEPDQHLNVAQALQLFLEAKKEAGRAQNTLDCYKGIIERTGVMDMPVASLQKQHLESFIYDPDRANATRHKRFRHIRAFLNWCKDQGYVNSTPDLPEPETYNKVPKAIREDELEAICQAIREDYKDKVRRNVLHEEDVLLWRIPVFKFAFYTGMRASELGRLLWRHVDLGRKEVVIVQQKNRNEDVLPLSQKAVDVLKGLDRRSGLVFCGPRTDPHEGHSIKSFRSNLSQAFADYKKLAGIERPVSFHGLRHGFCTRLAEQGASAHTIQRLARHDSIESSMQYIHLSNRMLRGQLDDAFAD
jgi:integrase